MQFRKLLKKSEGIDASAYELIIKAMEQTEEPNGHDEQGRLKIAMFDAKKYDLESFSRENQQRFDIHPFEFSLNAHSASSTAGFKVICVFVNDTVDAEVVKILAEQGVELIALR